MERNTRFPVFMAFLTLIAIALSVAWYMQLTEWIPIAKGFLIVFIPCQLILLFAWKAPDLLNGVLILGVILLTGIALFLIATKNQEYSGYALGYLVVQFFIAFATFLQWNNKQKATNSEYAGRVGWGVVLAILSGFIGLWSGYWEASLATFIGLPILILVVKMLKNKQSNE